MTIAILILTFWLSEQPLSFVSPPSSLLPGLSFISRCSFGFYISAFSVANTEFIPSSAYYRILPVRQEILLGILYCDLIGFHTYDYARHFLSSCTRILALPTMPNGVEFEGRLAHVGTFPIGIDPSSFTQVRPLPAVPAHSLVRSLNTVFTE